MRSIEVKSVVDIFALKHLAVPVYLLIAPAHVAPLGQGRRE